ncbi:MAG: alpha-E domain-containing protein [Deinococcales bacterium]
MLSRIAENLYWMGRYIERAENTARLLNVNYLAMFEAPHAAGGQHIVTEKWTHLLDIMESKEAFFKHHSYADEDNVPYWLALHGDNFASIRSSLYFARENARSLRNHISTEMWEAINKSYLKLCTKIPERLGEDALYDYCVSAREASHLFFGIAHATLPHDLGWSFMRAGQFLERADNTLRTLQANLTPKSNYTPVEAGLKVHRDMALLKSVSAYEAFRKHYHQGLSSERIYEFLLFNKSFPRSVYYSLKLLSDYLEQIYLENPESSTKALEKAKHLTKEIEDITQETRITKDGNPSIPEVIRRIGAISDRLSAIYFNIYPDEIVSQEQRQC